ncbi:hypothetical protein GCM10027062_35150 [Nocardioides hungaricus]
MMHKSLTWDQANEMATHAALTLAVLRRSPARTVGAGLNENSNGLTREYLPKGEAIRGNRAYLDAVAEELNERPRAGLDYLAPREAFGRLLAEEASLCYDRLHRAIVCRCLTASGREASKGELVCGVAGLSVGCGIQANCPLASLIDSRAAALDGQGTEPLAATSVFDAWDERASVRTAPRRLIESDTIFPPAMVPVLAAGGPAGGWAPAIRRSIAVQHLYRYLSFTCHLETLVVNPVLMGIFSGSIGAPLSDAARLDVLRMYTDEGHHAQVAFDLKLQIERRTGIVDRTVALPQTMLATGIHRIESEAARSQLAALFRLMFVIVSETLISGNLRDVSRTPGIDSGVAAALDDHARDEGRHHAFFAGYLRHLWGALTREERTVVAEQIPAMISTFLAPEVDDVREELLSHNISRHEVHEVLERAYNPETIAAETRAAATPLLRYLAQLDVFDLPGVSDAFICAGLLPARTQEFPLP